MLPALGYTLPTHATDCLKDAAVEAADFVPSQFSDATQLSTITSQHPFGLVNFHLGTLALSDNLDAWCQERAAIRQLCHLLEIELDVDRQQHLARSSVEELLELQEAVFKDRSWPER